MIRIIAIFFLIVLALSLLLLIPKKSPKSPEVYPDDQKVETLQNNEEYPQAKG